MKWNRAWMEAGADVQNEALDRLRSWLTQYEALDRTRRQLISAYKAKAESGDWPRIEEGTTAVLDPRQVDAAWNIWWKGSEDLRAFRQEMDDFLVDNESFQESVYSAVPSKLPHGYGGPYYDKFQHVIDAVRANEKAWQDWSMAACQALQKYHNGLIDGRSLM